MKKHTLWITGCCGLWILLAAAAPAQRQRNSAADAAGDPFAEEFSIITQRNIFDPNRQASRPRDTVQVTRTPAPTPVPVRTIDLYGAFIRDNEAIALVGGDTVLSGELRIGDKLGDWEVTAINTMGVLLTKEDDMMSWAVGQRLQKAGDQDWQTAGAVERQFTSRPITSGPQNVTNNRRQQQERQAMMARGGRGGAAGGRGGRGGQNAWFGGDMEGMDGGFGPGGFGNEMGGFGGPGGNFGGPGGGNFGGAAGAFGPTNVAPAATVQPPPQLSAEEQEDLIRRMMERRARERGEVPAAGGNTNVDNSGPAADVPMEGPDFEPPVDFEEEE